MNTTLIGALAEDGRGAVGVLLRDQVLAGKVRGTVSDFHHASSQADALISNLESSHASEKIDQLISSVEDAAAQADQSAVKTIKLQSRLFAPLLSGNICRIIRTSIRATSESCR